MRNQDHNHKVENEIHNHKVENDILFIPLIITLLILTVGWLPLFVNFFAVNGVPGNPTLQFNSWTHYQDNPYSQGVAYIEVYDNSTGSFKLQENITNSENGCLVNASCSVQLIIGYVANRTQLGWDVADNSLGRNFLQFNVTVTLRNGTQVFTQQNGTYGSNRYLGDQLYLFEHSLILNFETEYQAVYDVVINYDNSYGGGFLKKYLYWNDMSNATWHEDSGATISSDGDLFTANLTAGASTYVRDDAPNFTVTNSTFMEIDIDSRYASNTRVRLWLYNSTADVHYDVMDYAEDGVFTTNLGDIYTLDTLTQIRIYITGTVDVHKNFTLDYLNVYTWEKAFYGSRNDMGSTAFVDEEYYGAISTTGSAFDMTDDEAGHDWQEVIDWFDTVEISELNLAFFPDLLVKTVGGADPNWVNWSVRLYWQNGTNYDVIYQNTTWGTTVVNVLDFCDSENTTIIGFMMICGGIDNTGSRGRWDWLHFYNYDAQSWHTQTLEAVVTVELFEGMLIAGVALIGLCMIPGGMVLGAFMVKHNRSAKIELLFKLFFPLMLIVLGFAFFIGGL